ncbi:MAG: efflux RND transporter permease subunit [Leptospirales bacterium]|nr:efflux RND transporter permease subunit [Leptospirales bacterium]
MMIELAVRRRIAVFMIFLAIALAGAISIQRLRVDLFPDMEIPRISALTLYAGAPPEEIEALVTRPMEEALSSVNGVQSLRSRSEEGLSVVEAQLEWGAQPDLALIQMRQKADLARQQLPEEASRTILLKFDPSQEPLVLLAAEARQIDPRALRDFLEREVRPLLERIPGVAAISIQGGERREIQVEADSARLHARQLNLAQLSEAISAASFQTQAGRLRSGDREFSVRMLGDLRSAAEVANVIVRGGDGPLLRVSDVASVRDDYREPRGAALYKGQPATLLALRKEPGKNAIDAAAAIAQALGPINSRFERQLHLSVISDQSRYIQNAVSSAAWSAVLGGGIAFAVLLVFLNDIRAALIIAASIPSSMLAAFAAMDVFGLSLNLMSLGGLAAGAGMLVDNSIVALEAIAAERERRPELLLADAAALGIRRIASSSLASTLTSVIVFLPIVFLSGLAAAVFRDLALTVAISLLASLACALLLTPALATLQPSPDSRSDRIMQWMQRRLEPIAAVLNRWIAALARGSSAWVFRAVARPQATVILLALVSIGGAALFLLMERRLFPQAQRAELSVRLALPPGVTLQQNLQWHQRFHQTLLATEGVTGAVTTLGAESDDLSEHARGALHTNEGLTRVFLDSADPDSSNALLRIERLLSGSGRIERELRSKDDPLADLLGDASLMYLEASAADRGDARRLIEIAHQRLQKLGLFRILRSTARIGRPELQLQVDRTRLGARGLTPGAAAELLGAALRGRIGAELRQADREIPVRIRLRAADRSSAHLLPRIYAPAGEGEAPLGLALQMQTGAGYTTTLREDQRKLERLELAAIPGKESAAQSAAENTLQELQTLAARLPVDRRPLLQLRAANQETLQSLWQMAGAFALSLALIYMLLAGQFESLLHPLVLGAAAPLTFAGAGLALFVSGGGLNIVSGIGMVMLAGLSVNAAIALYEAIQQRRAAMPDGADIDETKLLRILQESIAERARPIALTTLTTVLGLAPMAFGLGEGAELQAPMAIAVIGGLTASALLSLVAFPALYAMVELRRQRRSM